MAASSAAPAPQISPGEMQLLLSRAGLVLNPGQVADLVLAWRQLAGLIASIPHDRLLADDMALVFRVPSVAAPRATETAKTKAKAKAARPRSRPAAKVKAKAKTAPKRQTAGPAPRKATRRGR